MVARLEGPETFASLRRTIAAGGVAIMPCDTIYGIVGIAPQTEARIARIKRRSPVKPYLRLIADASWLPRFARDPLPQALRPYWPGPLTVVLPALQGGTVALRVPADARLRDLLYALDRPLASTSVNIEGSPPLERIREILRFEPLVDLIVDGGDRLGGAPSTLVDACSRPLRVLRQGALRLPDAVLEAPD